MPGLQAVINHREALFSGRIADIIAAEGGGSVESSAKTLVFRRGLMHTLSVTSVDGSPVLRQKRCHNADCGIVFDVCVSCDRGQVYCSGNCRETARRRQRSEANRRYQSSQKGRDAHRGCQRRHRDRRASVTDQGSLSSASPAVTASVLQKPISRCICIVCGKESRWTNPYPQPPRDFWGSARRSKKYVFA